MSTESFELHITLATPPDQVFDAWLDAEEHSDFTGGEAQIDPEVGGSYSAWDGYITGKTLVKEAPRRIVQSWRTSDFAEDDGDSEIELTFDHDGAGGTKLTLQHRAIPAGQSARYEQGWREFYFATMAEYFSDTSEFAKALAGG